VEDLKQSTVECVRKKKECASNITKKSVYSVWLIYTSAGVLMFKRVFDLEFFFFFMDLYKKYKYIFLVFKNMNLF
jgi:hypothetical protein